MKYTIALIATLTASTAFAGGNNFNGFAGAFAGTSGSSFSGNIGSGEATQETFGSAGQFSSLKMKRTNKGAEITAEVDGFSSSGSRGSRTGSAGNFGSSGAFNNGTAFGTFGSY